MIPSIPSGLGNQATSKVESSLNVQTSAQQQIYIECEGTEAEMIVVDLNAQRINDS